MKALAGTWELAVPEKWAQMQSAFVVLDGNGTFRLVAIGEVAGAPVRVGIAGSWQLQDQTVSLKVSQSSDLRKLVGQSASLRIVSLSSSTIVLQDEDGISESLHRSRLPASLPPELNGPIILLTGPSELTLSAPRPAFPSEAAQRDLRGYGIFRLHTDLRNGVVRRVEIERSSGNPILDKSAVTAFTKWYFKAPLLRQLQRRRDPSNTSGEIIVRVPWSFLHSGPSKRIGG
ncbi:MAG: TonB family protein [Chthoniobacterales bacterium]|nr:TonB family protein [Chthoniobacterales bacterium]